MKVTGEDPRTPMKRVSCSALPPRSCGATCRAGVESREGPRDLSAIVRERGRVSARVRVSDLRLGTGKAVRAGHKGRAKLRRDV